VTLGDLREISEFGWLERFLFGTGMRSEKEKFEFTPWMAICVISMIAGLVLAIVGLILSGLKQKKLNKYFPKDNMTSHQDV
jgi:hypothetical protein